MKSLLKYDFSQQQGDLPKDLRIRILHLLQQLPPPHLQEGMKSFQYSSPRFLLRPSYQMNGPAPDSSAGSQNVPFVDVWYNTKKRYHHVNVTHKGMAATRKKETVKKMTELRKFVSLKSPITRGCRKLSSLIVGGDPFVGVNEEEEDTFDCNAHKGVKLSLVESFRRAGGDAASGNLTKKMHSWWLQCSA